MNEAKRSTGDLIVHSFMNDGTPIVLRTIRPDDKELLREGIAKLSAESRYLRFFSPAPAVPNAVVEKLVDVDGDDHIAWGAICTGCEEPYAIGAVHAIRHERGGPSGEYSVAVLDAFHGQGVARMLTAALLTDCLSVGLMQLDVHILTENRAAAALIRSMGALRRETSAGVSDYFLDVTNALLCLRRDREARGLQSVLDQLSVRTHEGFPGTRC